MISVEQNKVLLREADVRKKLVERLPQFIGSGEFFIHPSGMHYSEGVHFILETLQCFWLVDMIASWQKLFLRDERLAEQQFWYWERDEDFCGHLKCFYDEGEIALSHKVYTDMIADKLELWVSEATLYLPTEH